MRLFAPSAPLQRQAVPGSPRCAFSRSIRRSWLIGLLAVTGVPFAATATLYVPIADADLTARAPLIIEGRVLAVEPAPGRFPATDYLIGVERLIKGDLPGSALIVRVAGGVGDDGIGLHLWGAPKYHEGDEALLFLVPRSDGTFAPYQFFLGAFHVEGEAGVRIATRDLSGALRVAPRAEQQAKSQAPSPAVQEPSDGPRDLDKFRTWLEDRVAGRLRPSDYFLAETAAAETTNEIPQKFEIVVSSTEPAPQGCGENGGHSLRWFEFDQEDRVGWRTHFSGQNGLPNGGVDAFRDALSAWTADPNSSIQYIFLGLTGAAGSFSEADGINSILFGDPNGEIAGTFEGGGLLALGGPRFSCELREYQGESFHPILEADILTQDGIELLFASVTDPEKTAEQLFAHELGHTLGLGHTSELDALMAPELHPDARGAALDIDDLAGVLTLYGTRDLEAPTPPADLTARLVGANWIMLEWTDTSDTESVFRIDRRATEGTTASDFSLLTTVAVDGDSFVDRAVSPETSYTYRLRAQNGAGASAYSETTIATGEDQRPEPPTNLRVAPLSTTEVRLAWQDNSNNEDGYFIEVQVQNVWVGIPTLLPPDSTRAVVAGLTPDITFPFRIRAYNLFGDSDPTNVALGTTFPLGSLCEVSSERSSACWGEDSRSRCLFDDPKTDGPREIRLRGSVYRPERILLVLRPREHRVGAQGARRSRSQRSFLGVSTAPSPTSSIRFEVTDTQSGETTIYHNPPGEVCGLADTFAFAEELAESRADPRRTCPARHAARPPRWISPP